MQLEKITKLTCKCSSCGTIITIPLKDEEDFILLKDTYNCSTCHNALSPYFSGLITQIKQYNSAVESLKAHLSATRFEVE